MSRDNGDIHIRIFQKKSKSQNKETPKLSISDRVSGSVTPKSFGFGKFRVINFAVFIFKVSKVATARCQNSQKRRNTFQLGACRVQFSAKIWSLANSFSTIFCICSFCFEYSHREPSKQSKTPRRSSFGRVPATVLRKKLMIIFKTWQKNYREIHPWKRQFRAALRDFHRNEKWPADILSKTHEIKLRSEIVRFFLSLIKCRKQQFVSTLRKSTRSDLPTFCEKPLK